jgi:hypothetical protein
MSDDISVHHLSAPLRLAKSTIPFCYITPPYVDEHGNKVYPLILSEHLKDLLDEIVNHDPEMPNALARKAETASRISCNRARELRDLMQSYEALPRLEGIRFQYGYLNDIYSKLWGLKGASAPPREDDGKDTPKQRIQDAIRGLKSYIESKLRLGDACKSPVSDLSSSSSEGSVPGTKTKLTTRRLAVLSSALRKPRKGAQELCSL